MRLLAILLAGWVMLAGCSKGDGPATNAQPDQKEQSASESSGYKETGQSGSELEKPVQVKYEVKANGPIGSGKFKVNGEARTFCGDDHFSFSFETNKEQDLMLKAMSRKNQVRDLTLIIYVNGKIIKKHTAKPQDLFIRGSVDTNLNKKLISEESA